MKAVLIAFSIFILIAAPVTAFARDEKDIPEYTVEGLKRVPGTRDVALVWAEPGVDLSVYKRVYLVEPLVAFKKNWRQDQNRGHPSIRVKPSDMEDIKREFKEIFMEVFTEELLSAGYEFSEVRDEDVLIIKPAILDLDVNAPDIPESSTTEILSASAGSMTLYMELYDSVTEDLLVKAMDPTHDRQAGEMQWQTKVSNRAAARRMMKPWAEALRRGFDISRDATRQQD
jgi:hypothetical protein